jgi:hypothetical protein
VLGGGEIRQGKKSDFLKPNSQLWKNIVAAKVVMKGHPSNFKVRIQIDLNDTYEY